MEKKIFVIDNSSSNVDVEVSIEWLLSSALGDFNMSTKTNEDGTISYLFSNSAVDVTVANEAFADYSAKYFAAKQVREEEQRKEALEHKSHAEMIMDEMI